MRTNRSLAGFTAALAGLAAFGAAPLLAQQAPPRAAPAKPAAQPAQPASAGAQIQRSIGLINADVVAILNALLWDPALSDQLVKNPAGAQALLRARGAIRAEKITATKSAAAGSAITIAISHGSVSTTITI